MYILYPCLSSVRVCVCVHIHGYVHCQTETRRVSRQRPLRSRWPFFHDFDDVRFGEETLRGEENVASHVLLNLTDGW